MAAPGEGAVGVVEDPDCDALVEGESLDRALGVAGEDLDGGRDGVGGGGGGIVAAGREEEGEEGEGGGLAAKGWCHA